ncbi:WD repeat-containing protein 31 [Aphelenchoides bicaudatus]|nr:WD repeat-containing protein 31 [Aphelenchoides bicaudatus]
MGSGYSTLPQQDDNDVFCAQALAELRSKRCTSMVFNRQPTIRPALHSESINALAPLRPGVVISGSSDKTIIAHNLDTGECLHKWTGHEKEVTKVIYKHVGGKHFVLSGSRDTTVFLWRFNTPHPLQIFRGHELAVTGLALIDDTQFVSGGRDATVRLWDVETSKPIRTSPIARNLVTHIEKFPNTNVICQTSEDRTLKFWDSRSMSMIYQSPVRHQILTHCSLSADDPYCLTSSAGSSNDGCEVTLWDLRKSAVIREFRGHEASVRSAVFLPQQVTWKRLILSVSNDHTVRLWNMDDGTCMWTETLPTTSDLNACVGFQDGTVVVAGDNALLGGLKLYGKAGRPLLFCTTLQSTYHTDYKVGVEDEEGIL